jgi:hypothetical protein
MKMKFALVAAVAAALVPATTAGAAPASKGFLYHDGAVIRTVVVSAPVAPGSGRDPLYSVTNGADGQLGIAGVAPGDGPYHGGQWAVYLVTFNPGVTPYLLTSDEAVMAAKAAGDVTVTRAPDRDFRCPVQP